ncbi:TatA/E family subunit twin-arginine translocation protein [Methylophaga lonarensis MPL]|uniref:Sec-independent protein translocase protein TatA n=1 Tax=Methylophaga lonarensis MPL TaxID=1286106 RepID=M7NYV3_9GAMM|nr:Sec-independent protein translocase subunit TatA [Methylophaga lonarensis]EMR14018.1 TatA/E family subunit twin-arginine translocation protein [Methylophaga lonarensis MPL]
MGAMSLWHWVIVLVVVALVFGTKKLRNLGGDAGVAIKNFKDAVKDDSATPELSQTKHAASQTSSAEPRER